MLRALGACAVAAVLVGCGDPLAGLDRIGEVELSQTDPAAAALPTDAEVAREGFFGTEAANGPPLDASAPAAAEPPAKQGGLLGLLRRAVPKAETATAAKDQQADAVAEAVAVSQEDVVDPAAAATGPQDAAVQTAALAPEPEAPAKRRGLFGRKKAAAKVDKPRTGPDAQDVSYGTVLAYGLVARVCEAKGQYMGRKIQNAPAKGFALFDSAAGTSTARTWYVTGFPDGCPRQLTAANVLLGSATLYEQLHYGPTAKDLPFGATDAAYEGVKRKVCGARKGKPCGAKIDQMEKSTFFLSAYDSFGNSSRWSELLIHEGEVLASAVKTNR